MRSLTDKQKSVLDFIEGEIRLRHQPPTIKEVARHIGSENTRSGLTHIEALIRKGFLERSPGQARSLRLTGSGMALYDNMGASSREVPLLIDRGRYPDAPDTISAPASNFHPPPDYALVVGQGRSMPDRGIREGDILFVQRSLSRTPEEIVVYRDSATGEHLPGVLVRNRERLLLRSSVLEPAERELRKSELPTWVQGRVVALLRLFDHQEGSMPVRALAKELSDG